MFGAPDLLGSMIETQADANNGRCGRTKQIRQIANKSMQSIRTGTYCSAYDYTK